MKTRMRRRSRGSDDQREMKSLYLVKLARSHGPAAESKLYGGQTLGLFNFTGAVYEPAGTQLRLLLPGHRLYIRCNGVW